MLIKTEEAWFRLARYLNAADVLPAELLAEVQRYAAGEQLYIPRPQERLPWGTRTGARAQLALRNEQIRQRRREGASIEELMREFHLSYDSIRKILSGKNGSNCSRG
ncbi:conserved hypothetical protein [Symbiobacterium thermophilum IAM 14863]|uniref:Mor transcription activator domain-containing protein n=1 Tax=Symbiobacterium thermophilum (strain DSM 24528 / JCM 14929 / IAM 14863 / T) TaxID=292459 RepID=Q67T07_SYMTH|nr:conserved hypothetical protein [Symbiobacterium thermophilum IAM 14863]